MIPGMGQRARKADGRDESCPYERPAGGTGQRDGARWGTGHRVRGRGMALAAAGMLLGLAVACSPPLPLMGEGPPPGYISGMIPAQYRGLRSPYSLDDQRALAAGRTPYEARCATCHGAKGRGNGEKAPTLEPAPADFGAPDMLRAFREHQDYVYWWVSEGVPKTSMPAYKDKLTETERWQVITYAWHLGEQAAR